MSSRFLQYLFSRIYWRIGGTIFTGDHVVVRLVFRSLAIAAEGYASQSLGVLLFYVTDFPIKYRASTFTVRLDVKCYPARKCASRDAFSLFLHRYMIYKQNMHIYIYISIFLSLYMRNCLFYECELARARARLLNEWSRTRGISCDYYALWRALSYAQSCEARETAVRSRVFVCRSSVLSFRKDSSI